MKPTEIIHQDLPTVVQTTPSPKIVVGGSDKIESDPKPDEGEVRMMEPYDVPSALDVQFSQLVKVLNTA